MNELSQSVYDICRWMKEASKPCWLTRGPPSWRRGWCAAQETLSSSTTTWSRRWCWQRRTSGPESCTASSPTHGELPPQFNWLKGHYNVNCIFLCYNVFMHTLYSGLTNIAFLGLRRIPIIGSKIIPISNISAHNVHISSYPFHRLNYVPWNFSGFIQSSYFKSSV